MTARATRNDIANALDFLEDAGLIRYATAVAFDDHRVGWHNTELGPFLVDYGHATTDQYLAWVKASQYSALLNDGSLLQMTYRLEAGVVIGHRLAYVPCPVIIDEYLLEHGDPVADIVEIYLSQAPAAVALRSPIRFDYDPNAASVIHPSVHMTINSPGCRIACVAPLHPYRFIEFVYRHFYPDLRSAEAAWFDAAATQNIGSRVLTRDDATRPHIMWEIHHPPA